MKKNIEKFRLVLTMLIMLTLAMPFVVAAPAAAAILEVPGTHKTIQDAINDAKSGDTIIVYPGTYNECLVIDGKTSLTLQSLKKGEAIIDVEKLECDAIQVGTEKKSDGIIIDGFTICNAAKEKSGIRVVSGSELVIRNNLIRDCETGISLVNTHEPVISDVLVESNRFEGNHNGIMWGSGSNIVIMNNTFIDYDIGIYINETTQALNGFQVTGNEISGNNQGIRWTLVKGGKDGGTSPLVQYNNIYGNTEGVSNKSGGVMDATHNWWGHSSGPYYSSLNPYGQGDEISDGVNFEPWLLSEWVTTDTVHTKTDLLDEKNKSVDIPGVVEATAEKGDGIVTVGQYVENPSTEVFYGHVGEYVDVHITEAQIDDPEKYVMEELLVKVFYDDGDLPDDLNESSLMMSWWGGADWELCSDTGVDPTKNFIWARITDDTKPKLSDLVGTPFASRGYLPGETGSKDNPTGTVGGEIHQVNKVSVLAPWLILTAIIAIFGTIVVMKRRTSSQE